MEEYIIKVELTDSLSGIESEDIIKEFVKMISTLLDKIAPGSLVSFQEIE